MAELPTGFPWHLKAAHHMLSSKTCLPMPAAPSVREMEEHLQRAGRRREGCS